MTKSDVQKRFEVGQTVRLTKDTKTYDAGTEGVVSPVTGDELGVSFGGMTYRTLAVDAVNISVFKLVEPVDDTPAEDDDDKARRLGDILTDSRVGLRAVRDSVENEDGTYDVTLTYTGDTAEEIKALYEKISRLQKEKVELDESLNDAEALLEKRGAAIRKAMTTVERQRKMLTEAQTVERRTRVESKVLKFTTFIGATNFEAQSPAERIAEMKNDGWRVVYEQTHTNVMTEYPDGDEQPFTYIEEVYVVRFERDVIGDGTGDDENNAASAPAVDTETVVDDASNWNPPKRQPVRVTMNYLAEQIFSPGETQLSQPSDDDDQDTKPVPPPDVDETQVPGSPKIERVTVVPGADNAVYGVSALPDELVTLPDDAPDTYEEALECPWLTSEQRSLIATREAKRAGARGAARMDAIWQKHMEGWDDFPPANICHTTARFEVVE